MTLWIALHTHRHGTDVYPFFQENTVSEEQVIARIEKASGWEPEREEFIEVNGPWPVPAAVAA